MPSPKINKRERTIDDDAPADKKQKTSDESFDDVTNLQILPRDEWKTDSNYRLICKVAGCGTRGRGDRDDMCKRHYSMFRSAGRITAGGEGRGKKKAGRPRNPKEGEVEI